MAVTCLAVGIGVVIKVDITPSSRIVAIGALTRPVPGGRHMA